jgi:hypothetical protein
MIDDLRYLNYHQSLLKKIPLPTLIDALVMASETKNSKYSRNNNFDKIGMFLNETSKGRTWNDDGDPVKKEIFKEKVLASTLRKVRLNKEQVEKEAEVIEDEDWPDEKEWLKIDDELKNRANKGLNEINNTETVNVPPEFNVWDLDESGRVIYVGPDDPFAQVGRFCDEPIVTLTVDIKGAFKNMRVTKESEKLNAIAAFNPNNNKYEYCISKRAVFGSLHSIVEWCAISEVVNNAVKRGCLQAIMVYVDDLFANCKASMAIPLVKTILRLLNLLGLPWAYKKIQVDINAQVLGMIFRLINEPAMGITEKYREKLLRELDEIINNNKITAKEAHRMYGRLSFPITNTLGKTINIILSPITQRAYADDSRSEMTTKIKQSLVAAKFIIKNLKDKILIKPDVKRMMITDASAMGGVGRLAIFWVLNPGDEAQNWRFNVIRIILPTSLMDPSVATYPINTLEMMTPLIGIKMCDVRRCVLENANDNRTAEVSLMKKASKKAVLDSLGVLAFRAAYERKIVLIATRTKSKTNISDLGTRSQLWKYCLKQFGNRIDNHVTIDLRVPAVKNDKKLKWLVEVIATRPIAQQFDGEEDILDQLTNEVRPQVKWMSTEYTSGENNSFDEFVTKMDEIKFDDKDALIAVSDEEDNESKASDVEDSSNPAKRRRIVENSSNQAKQHGSIVENIVFESRMLKEELPKAQLLVCDDIKNERIMSLMSRMADDAKSKNNHFPIWKSTIDTPYVYGKRPIYLRNSGMSEDANELVRLVNMEFNTDLNSILINKFAPNEVLPAHADDEALLFRTGASADVEQAQVISITERGDAEVEIAVARKWKKNLKWGVVCRIKVGCKTAFRMNGYFQKLFTHKITNSNSERVSFTFRKVYTR